MKEKEFVTAIVLAAGRGTRMGTKIQKQYLDLCGKPVLYYSLHAFQESPLIDEILLVTGEQEIEYCRKEIVEKISAYKSKKNTCRRGRALSFCLEWNPGSRK
mgnify:FL=1